MVKAIITFVLISFTTTTSTAQELERIVLYDVDKFNIKEIYQSELRQLFKNKDVADISRITLIGHTDSDASDNYNLNLSRNRVEGVKKFIMGLGIPEELISSSHVGESEPRESNATAMGKQANRRVQLIIQMKPLPLTTDGPTREPKIDCSQDTSIQLPTGGFYTINICDYRKNPNCVTIKEINTAESMAENGLNTMSEDGDALISAGMVDYKICEGVEVKYYLPIREDCDMDEMTLWQLNEEGLWTQTSPQALVPVTVNGQRYYELGLSGSGIINCDKIPEPLRTTLRKTRFKMTRKSGMQIVAVTLYCGCPLRGARQTSKKNKNQKVVVTRPKNFCCQDMRVMIEALDENGNTVTMNQRLLTDLDGNTYVGSCPTTDRSRFLFIRTRNKAIHRKYKLHKNDFD